MDQSEAPSIHQEPRWVFLFSVLFTHGKHEIHSCFFSFLLHMTLPPFLCERRAKKGGVEEVNK